MAKYDRRAFAQAYLDAHAADATLHVHHQQVLSGLQYLFGLTLEHSEIPAEHQPLFALFTGTAQSALALRTPDLAETVQWQAVSDAVERIKDLTAQSREAHLDILEALLEHMLGEQASQVFSSADLLELGIDD